MVYDHLRSLDRLRGPVEERMDHMPYAPETSGFFSRSTFDRILLGSWFEEQVHVTGQEGIFMATGVQIRQGNQIGGCMTIVTYTGNGKTTRIMIDYGMSLPGAGRKEDYAHDREKEPVDAVFFTHYHGDHAGRFPEIPAQTKLYLGGASREVMTNIYQALTRSRDLQTAALAGKALTLPQRLKRRVVLRNEVHSRIMERESICQRRSL